MGPLMAAAHPDAFTLMIDLRPLRPLVFGQRHKPSTWCAPPRPRRASGAHRIDGVGNL
jgi:hypothetical protein